MLTRSFLIAALCCIASFAAQAQDRQTLGFGYLAVNDGLAEQQDRWRTGSLAVSYVRGPEWTGALPTAFGALLEFRFLGEVISPANIVRPAPNDRPFVGSTSFGVHTHFRQRAGTEWSLGADLVLIGPQTGLDQIQGAIHDLVRASGPSTVVRANQIDDDVIPSFVAEVGYPVQLSASATLRPFVELRAGVENLVRAGADLSIGPVGQGELMVRNPVTGQRYRAVRARNTGLSWVIGADVAAVDSSAYLPRSRGFSVTNTRTRARMGVHWQGDAASVFYGLTHHSKEFDGQPSDQFTGAIQIHFKF